MSWSFFMFSGMKYDIVGRFVDISGIVVHHYYFPISTGS
jgi:hypothetical protein